MSQSVDRRAPRSLAWFLAVIALLACSAAYISSLISEREAVLRGVSRYNVSQSVGQAALELARLQAAVGVFGMSPGEPERQTVQMWLDILGNRIGLLEQGEVGAFVRSDPEFRAMAAEIKDAVEQAQPLVHALDDADARHSLMAMLSRLNPRIARLAAAAHARAGDLATRDVQELARLHDVFSSLLMVLVACALGLAGVLVWHNRLLRRAHRDVHLLVDDLRRTGVELAAANEQAQLAMAEAQMQNRILKERDRDLNTRNARFDAALNNMSQGLCMVDPDQRLIVCNVRFLELFGLRPDLATPGVSVDDLFQAMVLGGHYDADVIEGIHQEQLALATGIRPGTFFREGKDGRAVAVAHQPMADGGWVATYEDITERRRTEARIWFLAHHDALTGLPNRVLFRDRMGEALQRLQARRGNGEGGLALLCLDLDHFKNVNDTLGHAAGDMLLEAVSRRLQHNVRGTDVVARLSGDEFAVLQLAEGQPQQAEALAQRLVDAVAAPFDVGGHRVLVGVSIGISVAPDAGTDAEQLLKNADMALYQAKADGRGRYRLFEAKMHAEFQARRAIEADLREALEAEQFEVFYQPLFDLRANRIGGYEALVRWRHPKHGLIQPAHFVSIAEEMGLIVPIGEWVLRRACADAAAWPEHIKVAVNLSPMQFKGCDVACLVADALERSGLTPNRLEIEITESTLLQDNEKAVAMLHRLRSLGLRTALDDFGTGYSSLSLLNTFPFDKIKIDRSFVAEMGTRPDCLAIVNSIADLAQRLGKTTTAEGIETIDQLALVREAGCTEAQGYYFGVPMPLQDVLRQVAGTGAGTGTRTGLAAAE